MKLDYIYKYARYSGDMNINGFCKGLYPISKQPFLNISIHKHNNSAISQIMNISLELPISQIPSSNTRYLTASKLFTCFIFYVEESQNPQYSELQKLKKMQKMCQKRALEVNKKAKEEISKVNLTEEIQDPKPKPPPQVRLISHGFMISFWLKLI